MTKISSKSAYPIKTPIKSDYFVGSNSENFGQTVNFGFEETAKLVNDLNGTSIVNYLYDTSPYISTEVLVEGKFLSLDSQTDTSLLTKLYINKFNHSGDNLEELYLFLKTNATDFYLKLRNSNNQNNAVYFDITSIEDFPDYFIFNIAVFKENEFLPLLENLNVYFFNFELKATAAGTSDPLKLDKADYTGNATDIDNRIIVLENLQNLNTNFTGQAFAVWTGVGYVYDVMYPDYYIQGVLYPGATEQKTLAASDSDNPRFDVFVVNATGAIVKTGIAEENPLVPTIDTETELLITSQLVVALSTEPTDNTLTQVYDENAEWTATSNNSSAVNFDATGTPYKGTKHGDIGAFVLGQSVKFTNSTVLSVLNYTTLKFALNLKGNFGKTKKILVQFMNGTDIVSSAYYFASGQNNFAHNIINSYQLIVIDFSSFTFTDTAFDGININFGSANSFGFRLDDVAIVNGSTVVSPTQKALTSIVTDSGIANATIKDDTFQFKGANGLVVSAVGKIITFTSNFTATLKTNYDSAYAWVLANGANVMTHLSRTDNPHNVTKSQVGLSNVDNTSDASKPVSTAQQTALDLKVDKITGKGLSTEDYTTSEKNKLASIDATHYLPPLQTTVELSALPQAGISDKARVYVENDLSDYFYDATASSGDIAPDDQVGGIGFWRIVAVGGETAASIKTKYESNADTNAFTDSEQALVATVAGKEPANANIQAHISSTHAPNDAQKNSDITKAEIEAKLVGSITSHTHDSILPVTETETSFSLTDAYNGKVVILTASCTVTIPNGLVAGFEVSVITLAGVTLTIALGGSVVLFNNAGLTMAEKLSFTLKNRTATNNYISTGNL